MENQMENQTEQTAQTAGAEQEKKQISISGILADLGNGMTREEIRLKYGVKKAQFARIMNHEKLKGHKTKSAKKNDPFELVDDAPEATIFTPRQRKAKTDAAVHSDGTALAGTTNSSTQATQTEEDEEA